MPTAGRWSVLATGLCFDIVQKGDVQAASEWLTLLDADVIETRVSLGLGLGLIAGMAFDPVRVGPQAVDVGHLFGSNTMRIGLRRGTYIRQCAYDFIHFSPRICRRKPSTGRWPAREPTVSINSRRQGGPRAGAARRGADGFARGAGPRDGAPDSAASGEIIEGEAVRVVDEMPRIGPD
jgi:hypothetical protein